MSKQIWPNGLCNNCDAFFTYRLEFFIHRNAHIKPVVYNCTSDFDCFRLFIIALPYLFNPYPHPMSINHIDDGMFQEYAKLLMRLPPYIRSEREEEMDEKCDTCPHTADGLWELCDEQKTKKYFCDGCSCRFGNAWKCIKKRKKY